MVDLNVWALAKVDRATTTRRDRIHDECRLIGRTGQDGRIVSLGFARRCESPGVPITMMSRIRDMVVTYFKVPGSFTIQLYRPRYSK